MYLYMINGSNVKIMLNIKKHLDMSKKVRIFASQLRKKVTSSSRDRTDQLFVGKRLRA